MPEARQEHSPAHAEAGAFSFDTPDGLKLSGTVLHLGCGAEHAVSSLERGTASATPESTREPTPRQALFLTGNGLPVQSYRSVLTGCADLEFPLHLHALDHAGHGRSEAPPREAPEAAWERLLRHMRAYVEQRLEPPALLIGHSMGAMLSLRLAAEQPQLVRGLILLDPLVPRPRGEAWGQPPPGSDGERLLQRTELRRQHWPSREAAAAELSASRGYSHWAPEAFADFIEGGFVPTEDGGVRLACPPWLEQVLYQGVPQEIAYRWAAAARAPTVILHGEDSNVIHPEGILQLADDLGVATVLTLPGSHTFPMEHPRQCAAALRAAMHMLIRHEANTA